MAGTSSVSSSTASISGLVSGLDTASIVSQLMQIESQPQLLLQQKLSDVTDDAVAYRDVNSSFAGLATAAQALTDPNMWRAMKATSTDSTVAATSTAGAAAGSVTFTVQKLAQAHSMMSTQKWAATSTTMAAGSSLTITQGTGSTAKTTTIATDGLTLSGVVDKINAAGLGLSARTVKTANSPDAFQLQVTSTSTGSASTFGISFGTAGDFSTVSQGQDADVFVGTGGYGYDATSSTNTFSDLLAGTSFTVSQEGASATVSVGSDVDGITAAVQKVVDAANAAIKKVQTNTDSSTGSTAPLKGDWALISLGQQILDAVTTPVTPGVGGTAGLNGLTLTTPPDGTLTFDPAKFKAALAANPALVQQVFSGATAPGADNIPNTPDDAVAVQGLGARLQQLAYRASDKATGSLTLLANGEDTTAKDIQSQIDDWTTRLALRQQSLTDQFNAMESALGTLQSQSSWLTSQINSLAANSAAMKK